MSNAKIAREEPLPVLTILSPHAWHDVWQRPHHLAVRFAKLARTAYIAPRWAGQIAASPVSYWRWRRAIGPGAMLLRAPMVLNGEQRIPWLKSRNEAAVGRGLAQARAELARERGGDVEGPWVLWIYDPRHAKLAESAGASVVVYDIMDDYTAFPWSPRDTAEKEKRLLQRADLVFAGTRALHDKHQNSSQRIFCEPSGVEAGHFAPSSPSGEMEHHGRDGRATACARHTAGYAGVLDGRLDQAALAEAARRLPDWTFILVGPKTCGFSALEQLPNIRFLGQRPYEDLPGLYHSWDVGMIPFVKGPLTDRINPTKTLEYFAAGLPVVSSEIPDLLHYYRQDIVFYSGPDSLFSALQRATAEESGASKKRRMELALARSWDVIAERMWSLVLDLVPGSR